MAKFIRFKDAAADQHAYTVDNIRAAYIADATSIIFYMPPIDTTVTSSTVIDITVTTGKAQEILDEILKGAFKIDAAVFEVSAAHADISAVAFTEGA